MPSYLERSAQLCLRIIVQADRIARTKGCQGDAGSLLEEK